MNVITIIDKDITHKVAATGGCVHISDWLDDKQLPSIIVSRHSVARLLAAILAAMEEGEG